MQAIRSKATKDEVLLAKTLWQRGHRYPKNDKTVFDKPDLTFKRYKLAIFVDSEYFHRKDWSKEIRKHSGYCIDKVEDNL